MSPYERSVNTLLGVMALFMIVKLTVVPVCHIHVLGLSAVTSNLESEM